MRLMLGDCVELMRELEPASVDAVVTDPPYELGFMGKGWDAAGVSFRASTWAEALRVLKPGGHLLAFGGSRTVHRIAVAIEDAGFEIRDTIAWFYGSGFPKSLDVAKAIDRKLGVEGTFAGVRQGHEDFVDRTDVHAAGGRSDGWSRPWQDDPDARERHHQAYEPGSDEARAHLGWGTALKPAFEPVVVARKPLQGTVAENVLAYGVGALNIDASRIEFSGDADRESAFPAGATTSARPAVSGAAQDDDRKEFQAVRSSTGRWPANVVLSHSVECACDCAPNCPVRLLDEQTGILHSGDAAVMGAAGADRAGNSSTAFSAESRPAGTPLVGYGDAGGASRFFYCAKTSRAERDAGLDGFESRPLLWSSGDQNPGSFQGDGTVRAARNNHPTVKPVSVMRWLVRLVTPPGGVVLDPFLGSGTTGIACALDGYDFVGIEREADYLAVAEARIRFWDEHGDEALRVVEVAARADQRRVELADAGQLDLDLFG